MAVLAASACRRAESDAAKPAALPPTASASPAAASSPPPAPSDDAITLRGRPVADPETPIGLAGELTLRMSESTAHRLNGNCGVLAEHFASCSEARCQTPHPLAPDKTLERRILGLRDGKCIYESELAGQGLVLRCQLDPGWRTRFESAYRSFALTGAPFREAMQHQNDELTQALEERVCSVVGAEPAQQAQPPATEPPKATAREALSALSGRWQGPGAQATIVQDGPRLRVTIDQRPTSRGTLQGSTLRVPFVDDGTCCTGEISKDHRTISWSNGTLWRRLPR